MRVLLSIMKKILFALFALASVVLFASDSRSEIAKKLYGRIYVVDRPEVGAYNVRVVNRAGDEDLRVRVVPNGVHHPGEWTFISKREVDAYNVYFVTRAGDEDINIRFVSRAGDEGPTR